MTINDEQLDAIREATRGGVKHFAAFDMNIVDEAGELVATVRKTIYVREQARLAQ